jgi:hypothetical protein
MGPKAPVGEPRPPVPRPRQMGPGNRAGPGDPAGEGSSRGGPVADPARGAVGEGWALVREGFCGRTGGERRVVSEPSAWRRVAAVRQSSRPAAPRMSALVQTEATRSGSRPTGRRASRHPRPALPGGAATDDRQIAGRRIGGTVPGDDSQAAGEGDRTGGMRDRDCLATRSGSGGHINEFEFVG